MGGYRARVSQSGSYITPYLVQLGAIMVRSRFSACDGRAKTNQGYVCLLCMCVYIYIEIVGLGICFQSSDVEDTDALM